MLVPQVALNTRRRSTEGGVFRERWGYGFLQEVDLGSWWEGDVGFVSISFWKVTWKFWKLPTQKKIKKSSSRNMGADVEVIFQMESS